MTDIAPFRGILFDPHRVDLGKVIAPPYDVIDAAQRGQLATDDPYNVVRLDLPDAEGGGDKYRASATLFERWLAEGVLRRDDQPTIYRYHQRFTSKELGDQAVVRRGFVCAIRLQPFSDRVVLPHERTLKGPRQDRFQLITTTRAHFSQVFGLFQDPAGEIEGLFRRVDHAEPALCARSPDGVEHRVWPVRDPELIGRLRRAMAPKKVYIADGHHRYESMLAARDHLARDRNPGPSSSIHYGSIFLSSIDDPGLIVLPTHRAVHGLPSLSRDVVLERARAYFAIDRLAGAAADAARIRAALAAAPAFADAPAFAAVFPGDRDAWRFVLPPHVDLTALGMTGHPAVQRLDVNVLHGLMLERILDITPAAQEAQTHLRYFKDTEAALAAARSGDAQAVFLLGAPRVDTVRHIADLGEIMPQKSTYFYPKLATGLVMSRIDPDDDLR